jgi:hypothetical protein
MPLPRINHFLSPRCHAGAGTSFALWPLGCNGAAESSMKIYLLIMLIGSLLAAVRFTSAPETQPETLPQ